MFKRRFVFFLFCLAMAAQIGASVAGAAPQTSGRLESYSALCSLAQSGHEYSDADKSPAVPHHHSSGCLSCPVAGGAPPLPREFFSIGERTAASVAPPGFARRLCVIEVLNYGAPPRAPPSRA
jgi:hypothetical protein